MFSPQSCIRWFEQSVSCVEKGCSYKLWGATQRRTTKCPFQTTRRDSGWTHISLRRFKQKNKCIKVPLYTNVHRVDILEKVYHQCGLCGELMLHDKYDSFFFVVVQIFFFVGFSLLSFECLSWFAIHFFTALYLS